MANEDLLKLDKRDRKILLELDRNCRQPLKKVAAAAGSALETTRYRIQRMEELGVIKNYLTVVDGGRLGFYYYKVFFRFHNVKEHTVRQIVDDLKADVRICWVVRLEGNFDIAFTPRVYNPLEQSRLLDELRWKYSKYLRRWSLSVNIKMDFFARDYLVSSAPRRKAGGSYSAVRPSFSIDHTGQKVLDALTKDPRMSAAAIGASVGVSTDTVISRINALVREQVIVRYALVTNVRALNHVNFYVLLYLNNLTPQREAQFCDFCGGDPHVIYLIKSLGEWDYELSIEAPTVQAYREVMMRITREFSDIIQEYNGMMVESIEKYIYP